MRLHPLLPLLVCAFGALSAAPLAGQIGEFKETGAADELLNTELAKKTQNPISELISLPIQSNFKFGHGPFDRTSYTMNIQPVYPMSITEDLNLIHRLVMPVVYAPDVTRNSGGTWGLGDTTYTAFFSPKDSGEIVWGLGPAVLLPTASDGSTGGNKWGLGPSVVALTIQGPWVIGALWNNIWSINGSRYYANINQMLLQPFVNYNLGDGWYLVTAPIITANWNASSGNTWTIPVGAGGGKVFKIGNQPINASLQAYYYVASPTLGPSWELRIQFQFLFPK